MRGWRVRRRVRAARQSARADAGSDGDGPDEAGADADPDRWLPAAWRLDAAAGGGGGRGGEAASTGSRGAELEDKRGPWPAAGHRIGPKCAAQHGAEDAGQAAGEGLERRAGRAHAAAGAQAGAAEPAAASEGARASSAANDGRGGRDRVQTHAHCLRRTVQLTQLSMGVGAAMRAVSQDRAVFCTSCISRHTLARFIVQCVQCFRSIRMQGRLCAAGLGHALG